MNGYRAIVIGLALLAATTAQADLKTYDVDPQYRQEVYAALKEILSNNNPQLGTNAYGQVELLPTGQLLVNAAPAVQAQVEAVLASIRSRPVAPTPRVELRYWAVLGDRAPNAAGGRMPPALNPVLAELETLQGDLAFRVIGSAALTTDSGQPGSVSGTVLGVEQTAYAQGDTLSAELSIEVHRIVPDEESLPAFASVEVTTTLKRGEFVVLGGNELQGAGMQGPVFFIVNWPEN
jgi:hypothetical protein